jgi:hypothetical protein
MEGTPLAALSNSRRQSVRMAMVAVVAGLLGRSLACAT